MEWELMHECCFGTQTQLSQRYLYWCSIVPNVVTGTGVVGLMIAREALLQSPICWESQCCAETLGKPIFLGLFLLCCDRARCYGHRPTRDLPMHSRTQILRAGRISAITTDTHRGQLLCSFHNHLCVHYQDHSLSPGNLACFFMLKINNSGTVCLALQSTISSPSSRVHRMGWVMEILI